MDYQGINHSRMTAAMEERLHDAPRAFLVLSRLRRLVGDGGHIQLYGGVRGWAYFLGCAAGYPKIILNRLAEEGFISVDYRDGGFADVTITAVTRDDQAMIPTEDDTEQPLERVVGQQITVSARSDADRNRYRESESKKQQQPGDSVSEILISEPDNPLYQRLMKQPNMHRPTARQIATNAPGSLADFEADLRLAKSRPDVRSPFWFTVGAWMHQARVSAVSTGDSSYGRSGRQNSADYRRHGATGGNSEADCGKPDTRSVPAESGDVADRRKRSEERMAALLAEADEQQRRKAETSYFWQQRGGLPAVQGGGLPGAIGQSGDA